MKKAYKLILFTITASVISYFAITLSYPFDRDLDSYANTALILKGVFVMFNIGMIVYILLRDNGQK